MIYKYIITDTPMYSYQTYSGPRLQFTTHSGLTHPRNKLQPASQGRHDLCWSDHDLVWMQLMTGSQNCRKIGCKTCEIYSFGLHILFFVYKIKINIPGRILMIVMMWYQSIWLLGKLILLSPKCFRLKTKKIWNITVKMFIHC